VNVSKKSKNGGNGCISSCGEILETLGRITPWGNSMKIERWTMKMTTFYMVLTERGCVSGELIKR